jgi:hypothetical protein
LTTESTASRLRILPDGGKEILFIDLAGATVAQSLEVLGGVPSQLEGKAPKSMLILVDVNGTGYDPSVSAQWKTTSLAHAGIVRAAAVYGMSGLTGLAVRGYMEALRLTGLGRHQEELRIFGTKAEALAWLLQL